MNDPFVYRYLRSDESNHDITGLYDLGPVYLQTGDSDTEATVADTLDVPDVDLIDGSGSGEE